MSDSVTTSLTAVLRDTYALGVKTHAAHWNVTGSGFFELHEQFGSQYEALLEAADELAERIRALGASAPAGIKDLAKGSRISDTTETTGKALVTELRNDHRSLSKACAAAVAIAQKADDEATADLLIGRIAEHDKTAWMLDAWRK